MDHSTILTIVTITELLLKLRLFTEYIVLKIESGCNLVPKQLIFYLGINRAPRNILHLIVVLVLIQRHS